MSPADCVSTQSAAILPAIGSGSAIPIVGQISRRNRTRHRPSRVCPNHPAYTKSKPHTLLSSNHSTRPLRSIPLHSSIHPYIHPSAQSSLQVDIPLKLLTPTVLTAYLSFLQLYSSTTNLFPSFEALLTQATCPNPDPLSPVCATEFLLGFLSISTPAGLRTASSQRLAMPQCCLLYLLVKSMLRTWLMAPRDEAHALGFSKVSAVDVVGSRFVALSLVGVVAAGALG